jgi:cold shock CspA family protein
MVDGLQDASVAAGGREEQSVHNVMDESGTIGGTAGVFADLMKALKDATGKNGSADRAASFLELLATVRQKLSTHLDAASELERTLGKDLARLRNDAVARYNGLAWPWEEGWLVPVACPSETTAPGRAAEVTLKALPPLAPPAEAPPAEQPQAEPPQAQQVASQPVALSWANHLRIGDASQKKIPSQQVQKKTRTAAPDARKRGFIKSLLRDRGFGFIASDAGGEDFFFHVRDCEFFDDAKVGDKVLFLTSADSENRQRAMSVEPAPAPVADKRGCIKSLVQEKGFGFISSGKGAADIFVHARDCQFSLESVKAGDKVLFAICADGQGRRRAVSVCLR